MTMLEKCSAIPMASDRQWIARCEKLFADLGFSSARPYLSLEDVARRARYTPVQFLFAHYRLDDADLRDTVRAIRHHQEVNVRYMPLIVFTKDPSAEALRHFLAMGFDDIVSFPCALDYLTGRLLQQIERAQEFFEAGNYFGPDRRRLLDGDEIKNKRGGGAYTRYVIERNPVAGVRVLSQERKGVAQAS